MGKFANLHAQGIEPGASEVMYSKSIATRLTILRRIKYIASKLLQNLVLSINNRSYDTEYCIAVI